MLNLGRNYATNAWDSALRLPIPTRFGDNIDCHIPDPVLHASANVEAR